MDDVTALRELHDFLWDEMEFFSDEADPDHQWTTQALGQKHDDLVERFHDAYPSLLAAVEARAALTPERLAAALVATTIFAGHAHDCPVWMNRMIELRGERVDLDTCTCWVKDEAPDRARRILAALPRPEEPRVERKVAKDIDAAVDELERLFHPEGRCAMCGGGRPYWKHDMGTYSDHPEGHPFAAEAR